MRRFRVESLLIRRTLGVAGALAIAVASAALPGGRVSSSNTLASVAGRSALGIRVGGGAGQTGIGPGSYIVVYRSTVKDVKGKTDKLQTAAGFRASHRYGRALKGFAARLSDRQLEMIRNDPAVRFVSEDRPVKALDVAPLTTGDSTPTGIRRMDAGTSTTARQSSGANVAVLDTGVDLNHSDLNSVHGKNCFSSAVSASDDNWHGTHVAGTIGARNNGSGVVGVAPDTKIYAVKVLDSTGSGTWSSVICGIDWATATRTDADPANDIAVANLSLGGGGQPLASCSTTTDPLHVAICNSTAAGVTYVVAAGNSGYDFDYAPQPDTPAVYPEVLTVTAVSDSDGLPGGNGGKPSCDTGESDDVYAKFSNFATTTAARAHTIAAPGVCIRSTVPGGGYGLSSGTSMATPHVAGAVALCLAEGGIRGPCAGMTPPQIIAKMRSTAESHTASAPAYGFAGDPLRPVSGRYFGYLTWAGLAAAAPAPDVAAPSVTEVSPPDGATGVSTGSPVTVTFDEPMDMPATQAAFTLVDSTNGSGVSGSFAWSGNTMTFKPSSALALGTSFVATIGSGAKDSAGNALAAEWTWTFKTVETVTSIPSSVTIQSGSLRGGTPANLAANDGLYYQVNSTTSKPYAAIWYGTITNVPNSLQALSVRYRGKNSASVSQTVWIYNWTKQSWVQLDSRTVGTTEVSVVRSPSGALADYVSATSGNGSVRVRVRSSSSSGRFYTTGDVMSITFTAS